MSMAVLDSNRHAADYADLILRGTPPGNIPIFQGTKFYLAINLKRARASGVSLPATLLAKADDVTE
jgi:putative ABC transport system substrate-binding protein